MFLVLLIFDLQFGPYENGVRQGDGASLIPRALSRRWKLVASNCAETYNEHPLKISFSLRWLG
jgi:hypothetical protein